MMRNLFFYVFLFPAIIFADCNSGKRNAQPPQNYHELIQKVIQKDEKYLNAFKNKQDKNWGNNWKLIDARIDAFDEDIITKQENGDKKEIRPDTNCILEWNNGAEKDGLIRRETYSSDFVEQSVDLLFYKNDSLYASGWIKSMDYMNSSFRQLEYFKSKIVCKPCDDYSYDKFVNSGQGSGTKLEEDQILDSLGIIQCSYSCPKFMEYHWGNKDGSFEVVLRSDTIITSNGTCPFVGIKDNN